MIFNNKKKFIKNHMIYYINITILYIIILNNNLILNNQI